MAPSRRPFEPSALPSVIEEGEEDEEEDSLGIHDEETLTFSSSLLDDESSSYAHCNNDNTATNDEYSVRRRREIENLLTLGSSKKTYVKQQQPQHSPPRASSSQSSLTTTKPYSPSRIANSDYAKYYKMLAAGVPMDWVIKVCEVDKKDPSVLLLDREQTLENDHINNASSVDLVYEPASADAVSEMKPESPDRSAGVKNERLDDKTLINQVHEPASVDAVAQIESHSPGRPANEEKVVGENKSDDDDAFHDAKSSPVPSPQRPTAEKKNDKSVSKPPIPVHADDSSDDNQNELLVEFKRKERDVKFVNHIPQDVVFREFDGPMASKPEKKEEKKGGFFGLFGWGSKNDDAEKNKKDENDKAKAAEINEGKKHDDVQQQEANSQSQPPPIQLDVDQCQDDAQGVNNEEVSDHGPNNQLDKASQEEHTCCDDEEGVNSCDDETLTKTDDVSLPLSSSVPVDTPQKQVPLGSDPLFTKYFLMLKAGVPKDRVRLIVELDGKDTSILDLDPDQTYSSQVGGLDQKPVSPPRVAAKSTRIDVVPSHDEEDSDSDSDEEENVHVPQHQAIEEPKPFIHRRPEPRRDKSTTCLDHGIPDLPLCKDPAYARYFLMLKARVPKDRVRNVVELDGKDPGVLDLDPNRSYASQIGANEVKPANNETLQSNDDKPPATTLSSPTVGDSGWLEQPPIVTPESPEKLAVAEVKEEWTGSDEAKVKLDALIAQRENEEAVLSQQKAGPNSKVSQDLKDAPAIERIPRDKLEALFASRAAAIGQTVSSESSTHVPPASAAPRPKMNPRIASRAQEISHDESSVPPTEEAPRAKLDALFASRAAAMGLPQHSSDQDIPLETAPRAKLDALFASRAAAMGLPQHSSDQDIPLETAPRAKLDALFASRAAAMGLPKHSSDQEIPLEAAPRAKLDALFASRAAAMGVPQHSSVQETSLQTAPRAKLDALFASRAAAVNGSQCAESDSKGDNSSSSEIAGESSADGEISLKDDPAYCKYFKMLRLGLPKGAVKQAMVKDGKDDTILDLDPNKSLAQQIKPDDPPLKDDPEYTKYFKMLKLGLPLGAVKQAMTKDGKDPGILDFDPEKSLTSQRKEGNNAREPKGEKENQSPPLKDDPEYCKFFKMLKLGLPRGAVKQAMTKDGKDPGILDFDPEKSLASQRKEGDNAKETKSEKENQSPEKRIMRKRLFWNSIDKSNLNGSLWVKAQSESALDLNGLDYDEDEFASLFTSVKDSNKEARKKAAENSTKPKSKKSKIQLIESRRQMNGQLLLAKYKHDYNVLAQNVDRLDSGDMEETELLALMQLLPSQDEALAIRSYLPDGSQAAKDDAISKLDECEKYMASMLDIKNAEGKFECMLYKAQFHGSVAELSSEIAALRDALTCVRNSDRLARLMVFALRLGNTLNTGAAGEEVAAITLDSLLKLHEAKAFDKKTSVLHYLVSIIQKNDEEVLEVSEELLPALKAERIVADVLAKSLSDLQKGLVRLKTMVEEISNEKDTGLDTMENFIEKAEEGLKRLAKELEESRKSFTDLLKYFGESQHMAVDEFFGTLTRFIAMFESARADVRRMKEHKARRERRSKAKESGAKSAKLPSPAKNARSAVLHDIVKMHSERKRREQRGKKRK